MDMSYIKKRLFEKYSPDEKGTWRILGEDPNCDFGGSHHEPELETVTGTYANVVEYALTLKSFFTWGHGGRIIKVATTVDVDKLSTKRVKELRAEKARLEKRLQEVVAELDNILK